MDSALKAQVQATMNALILTEALKPLTKGSPLGEYAAQSFAKLIAGHLGDKS